MKQLLILALLALFTLSAADRPGTVFKIFQFPANMIPRVDGNADDWKMVPDGLCNRHGPTGG